jgi:hypothetical protein
MEWQGWQNKKKGIQRFQAPREKALWNGQAGRIKKKESGTSQKKRSDLVLVPDFPGIFASDLVLVPDFPGIPNVSTVILGKALWNGMAGRIKKRNSTFPGSQGKKHYGMDGLAE